MEHVINKSLLYHQAKKGILADGIFSDKEIYDCVCGLIIFYLIQIREKHTLPDIKIIKLQKQKNYFTIVESIKKEHFQKIQNKDKKIFLAIFMVLEMAEKPMIKRGKI